MYSLETENFSGPIEKLLELVEAKRLDVAEVSLAKVTGDFLEYVSRLKDRGEMSPVLLAGFIVIASHLLLIKSKLLIPSFELTEEEQSEIRELERRVSFYQSLKPAIAHIRKSWLPSSYSFSRPLFMTRPAMFLPDAKVGTSVLHRTIAQMVSTLEVQGYETKEIASSLITIEEKVEELIMRLKDSFLFSEAVAKQEKAEIVVTFLAVLHLLKNHKIKITQADNFADIIIERADETYGKRKTGGKN